MDLDKLNELKNMDAEQLLKLIGENQNTLIKLFLIAGSLLVAGAMFNDYRVKSHNLSVQTSDAQQKLAVIKDRQTSLDNINAFKATIPGNLTQSELITLISKFAKSYDVTITSLSPGDSNNIGLFDLLEVSFDAKSHDFKNILFFMRKIETSKFSLRIDSWSGQENADGDIAFRIKINAVLIHT